MNVGFTGTRDMITDDQVKELTKVLTLLGGRWHSHKETWFHHGDCVGADSMAHEIARMVGYQVLLHPPINNKHRAYCQADLECSPDNYLIRNKNIVNGSDFMIATPNSHKEKLRSGTWSTVRYAKKVGKPLYIIYPDGTVEFYI